MFDKVWQSLIGFVPGKVMNQKKLSQTFDDYITVKEASRQLGVSVSTLRNWDRAGKFVAHRHPINHYRLYRATEVEELLSKLLGGASGDH